MDPLNDSYPRWSEAMADPVTKCAIDAATEQMRRMPSSNGWDYALAIVRALREAGMLADAE